MINYTAISKRTEKPPADFWGSSELTPQAEVLILSWQVQAVISILLMLQMSMVKTFSN
jgi:hypothetical protein